MLVFDYWFVCWFLGAGTWCYWVEQRPHSWEPSNENQEILVLVAAILLSPVSIILMATDLLVQRRKLRALEKRLSAMRGMAS